MPELELRAVAFQLRDDSADGDGLTLEGYAAVFDSPTFISDQLGEYEETVARGAFKRSVNARKPVLQFDHGQHPVLGSMPIGALEALAEDSRGLFVRARLFDNWMTEPLRDAIRHNAVDGMSFRFETIRDRRENWNGPDGLRKRTLQEVRLHELGPVVFPAYRDTSVSLRSLAAHVPGLTLALTEDDTTPPLSSTSDEPAAESRGTSDEPASDTPDPTPPSHSEPSTYAERQKKARQIRFDRRDK